MKFSSYLDPQFIFTDLKGTYTRRDNKRNGRKNSRKR